MQQRDRIGPHHNLVVVGSIFLCHQRRVFQLVVASLLETDGKGLDRLGRLESHGSDHQTGIDAAA